MDNIAYLVESTSVTNTGRINGKSLRTYEVTYTVHNSNAYWKRVTVKSTGKVFTIKNNSIKVSKTSANLSTKYVRSADVTSRVEDMPYYGCRLYSSPEIALISKAMAIKSRTKNIISDLESQLAEAKKNLITIPDTSEFLSQHPEYLI